MKLRGKKRTFSISNIFGLGEPASDSVLPAVKRETVVEPPASSRKKAKLNRKSTPGDANGQAGEKEPPQPEGGETGQQRLAALQVGRYLLGQFSVPAFRSHATIGLVDRHRIQYYHANHSVILVSSAIGFTTYDSEEGLDRFIAIGIAFGRLSLKDSGILHNLHNGKLFRDNEKLTTSVLPPGAMQAREGNKLEFGGDGKTQPFTLTMGEVIAHEPSLAGRSTAVLHATSPAWESLKLVVKISWPGSERVAEHEFLARAVAVANSSAERKWALKHLPQVLFAQDIDFGQDSTHEKVARRFEHAGFFNGEYEYEERTLRIIVQERLYPLKTLKNAKDVAQVLLDVGCSGWFHPFLDHNALMFVQFIDGCMRKLEFFIAT